MINNQIEFSEKYPKEKKEKQIKIRDENSFQGQLIIEDYHDLEKLYLRGVKSVDKVVLKNLNQLQKCTIWDCGVKELVIENCSWIKILNVRTNFLNNLEFIKGLSNLENLEIDGNTEINSGLEHLPESLEGFSYENTKLGGTLKLYGGDWKICKKDIQELKKLSPYELLKNIRDLKKENEKLEERQPVIIDNPVNLEQKYQELKKKLASLVEMKTQELNKITTSDLTKKVTEKKKSLEKETFELRKQLTSFTNIEQKDKYLEELKKEYIKKKQKLLFSEHIMKRK